jgi:DNA-directed RNA polymerase omega subunit
MDDFILRELPLAAQGRPGLNFLALFGILIAPSYSGYRRQVSLDTFGKIDSKYRFVIVASKRAKQLLRGAKPKVKAKTKNPIRLAQLEVKNGAVEYDILHTPREDVVETGERVFAADDLEEVDEGVGGSEAEEPGPEDVDHEDAEDESLDQDLPEADTGEEKDEG